MCVGHLEEKVYDANEGNLYEFSWMLKWRFDDDLLLDALNCLLSGWKWYQSFVIINDILTCYFRIDSPMIYFSIPNENDDDKIDNQSCKSPK